MVGDQAKEEQGANQILPRSVSLLQRHTTFADSCGRWDSGELNSVTGGVWDLWKQNSLSAEPNTVLLGHAPQGSQCHSPTLTCSTAVPWTHVRSDRSHLQMLLQTSAFIVPLPACSYKWDTRVCVCQICKIFTVNITNCDFCWKCHKGEESCHLQGSIPLKHLVCSVKLRQNLLSKPFATWKREGQRRKDGQTKL